MAASVSNPEDSGKLIAEETLPEDCLAGTEGAITEEDRLSLGRGDVESSVKSGDVAGSLNVESVIAESRGWCMVSDEASKCQHQAYAILNTYLKNRKQ